MATVNGTPASETLTGTPQDDTITGFGGNDTIFGLAGNDTAIFNVTTDGADIVDLGDGVDVVNVTAAAAGQVRVSFTSAQIGNGNVNDSNNMLNQDGGLAVRFQAEGAADALTGPVSRFEDEGITFVSSTAGLTFDVRDLVAGTQRGDQFEVVTLGSQGNDVLTAVQAARPYYFNAGAGDDTVTGGTANDFLVGGGGNDTLSGGLGNDSFIGGAGNDAITGGTGDDTAIFNVSTDGADRTDLGDGSDIVNVSAAAAGQIRLSFTSAEIGNGNVNDAGALTNQDGGLALRLQAEGAADALTGPVSRFDDEGVTFVAAAGTTFDVRDLVAGTQRGDQFEVVTLGTSGNDTLTAVQAARPYYFNAGAGDDTVTGGTANDFLVGGGGNDTLSGGAGNDSFIGGGGNDSIAGGAGDDTAIFNVSTDGSDTVDLGDGVDVVNVSAAAAGQVRLSFTSAQIGNGSVNDTNNMLNQDGGLAVRLQAEGAADALTGPVSRFEDEGITFVAAAGTTFDVRDLVAGTQRGDQFEVVTLGSQGNDVLTAVQAARSYYFNAGAGDDTVTGGTANDFLVGGGGNDTLSGGLGNDSFIGGAGDDVVAGGAGDDTAIFNVSTDGADRTDLGDGSDIVNVSAAAAGQIRLSFTSAQVGNGSVNDTNNMANQDGGLAVRLQAEGADDTLAGQVARFDDEGITFVAAAGTTFDVRDLVALTQRGDQFEVATLGTSGNDTLTAVQAARPYYFNAGAGDDTVTGGTANDFLVGGGGNDTLSGGLGNDSFIGGAGNDSFNGGAGTDRAIVTFALGAATVGVAANGATTITGPEGTDTFRGIEQFQFTDRVIDNADGSPLVDDLFYLNRYPDVAAAGQDADAHYFAFGASEGRDPNALFSTAGYLSANPDVARAGLNPLTHYDTVGFTQGRDPSALFDNEFYLTTSPDVRAAGLDPLKHYLEFGQAEGRSIAPAIGRSADIKGGFDAEYYLLANADVGRAAATTSDSFAFALAHYDQFGFKEGRNPNAVFDTKGYLSAYTDVAQAGINPLTHYDTVGFKEGRDPSVGFDSSAYLANYTDVAQAGLDPMQHYLQFGIYEGRSAFGDTTFGGGNVG